MKKPQKKKITVNIKSLIVSILSLVLIFGGSFLIYYLSRGYRIDINGGEIIKTGVLTVQSEPSSATLYINGEDVGKTPRSRILNTGTHTVSVWKEGYSEWRKEIDIKEEKSTPTFPMIFLNTPEKKSIWETDGISEKFWTNIYRDYFIFSKGNTDNTYTLYTYRINNPLWNLTPNPTEVLRLEDNNIEIILSPNGQKAILKKTGETTKYFMIDTQKYNSLEEEIILEGKDINQYKIVWSKDNRYLILESDLEILSLDTTENNLYTLITKNSGQTYIWNTDEEGFFYTIGPLVEESEKIYSYTLKQTKLDGSNPRNLIDKVYFQKDINYINHYRENEISYTPFTNSPESTQSIGQIISFEVNQTSKGVYIQTETSSYWYDIGENKYHMIAPYKTTLISFSPDSKKILLVNGDKIYVYTLDKDDGDHTTEIGTEIVKNITKENGSDFRWLSNSTYISYIKENNIVISEKDGENNHNIINNNKILLYATKSSRENIITLEQEDNTLYINQYKIQ